MVALRIQPLCLAISRSGFQHTTKAQKAIGNVFHEVTSEAAALRVGKHWEDASVVSND